VRALLLILGAASAAAQYDPTSFESPDGRFALHVDPTERSGAGPADLELTMLGELIWRQRADVTPRHVSVDDTGRVLGVGYTHGVREMFEGGDLVVVLLGTDGHERFRDEFPRRAHAMHSSDQPWCAGAPRFLSGDRALVRLVSPKASTQEWVFYNLTDGARGRSVVPGSPREGALLAAVEPVSGTQLLLVHWRTWSERGSLYQLLDMDGAEVWSLPLPGDHAELTRQETTRWTEACCAGVGVASSGLRMFSVVSLGQKKHMTFVVDEDEAVREVGSTPFTWSPPPPQQLTQPEAPRLALTPRGELALEAPPSHAPLHEPNDARVGPHGRLYVSDGEDGAVHVFDRNGRWSGRRIPDPADLHRIPYSGHLAVDAAGHLFVYTNRRRENGYVEFDSLGARVGLLAKGGDGLAFHPRTGVGWVDGYYDVHALSGSGRLERRADGRWFRVVKAHAFAPDGSLAVADRPYMSGYEAGPAYTLFDTKGRARVTYPVWFGDDELVRGEGWAACGGTTRGLRLLRESDGAVFAAPLDEDNVSRRIDLTCPPDHTELWVYDYSKHVLRKFAWPTSKPR
jgi:hypothetical protein